MATPAQAGLGYSLSVTNAGSIIFSSGGDLYSLAQSGCWGPGVKTATEPEKPNCTFAEAKQLTTGGIDSDATWTASTQPIVVNAPASAPTTTTTTTTTGGPIIPPAIAPPPVLSGVSETNMTWREGGAQATLARMHLPPIGTTFSFRLNESASVAFEFNQSVSGRKVGRSCVAQTKKNEHARRCTHVVAAGHLIFSAHAGVNKVHFDGLISKHGKLAPGSYTLVITATSSGIRSTPDTLRFTIDG